MILTAMNKQTPKAIKGYWSNGRFVKPEEIALEEVGPPSKTQLKAEAGEKQALGEALPRKFIQIVEAALAFGCLQAHLARRPACVRQTRA